MLSFEAQLVEARQTVDKMEVAAARHLRDATVLRDCGQGHGSIYLAGYVVEIYLKAAYFRASHAPLSDDWGALLPQARNYAATNCSIANLDAHNPEHWLTMLKTLRGAPIATTPPFADATACVEWFKRNWNVSMRYLSLSPTLTEVNLAIQHAGQLQRDYVSLRS